MSLIENWRRVLRYAWSIRLIVLAAVLSGLELVVQLVGASLPIPPMTLGVLSFVVTVAAFIARFVAQPSVNPKD